MVFVSPFGAISGNGVAGFGSNTNAGTGQGSTQASGQTTLSTTNRQGTQTEQSPPPILNASSLNAITKSTLFSAPSSSVSVPAGGPGGGTALGPNALPGGSNPPGVATWNAPPTTLASQGYLGANALPTNAGYTPPSAATSGTTFLFSTGGHQYAIPNTPTANALANVSLAPFELSTPGVTGSNQYTENLNNVGGNTVLQSPQGYYFANAPGVFYATNPTSIVQTAKAQTINTNLPNYTSPFTAIAQPTQQTLSSTTQIDYNSFGTNAANNLTFTSPTNFYTHYVQNGVDYELTGAIPTNIASQNTDYSTNPNQQAINAAVDAAYAYLTGLSGLNAISKGSTVSANVNSFTAPSVTAPPTTITPGASTIFTPGTYTINGVSQYIGSAQTYQNILDNATTPLVITAPFSTIANTATYTPGGQEVQAPYATPTPVSPSYLILPQGWSVSANGDLYVGPSNQAPTATQAEQYANALLQVTNLSPKVTNAAPPTSTYIPNWQTTLQNAGPQGTAYLAALSSVGINPNFPALLQRYGYNPTTGTFATPPTYGQSFPNAQTTGASAPLVNLLNQFNSGNSVVPAGPYAINATPTSNSTSVLNQLLQNYLTSTQGAQALYGVTNGQLAQQQQLYNQTNQSNPFSYYRALGMGIPGYGQNLLLGAQGLINAGLNTFAGGNRPTSVIGNPLGTAVSSEFGLQGQRVLNAAENFANNLPDIYIPESFIFLNTPTNSKATGQVNVTPIVKDAVIFGATIPNLVYSNLDSVSNPSTSPLNRLAAMLGLAAWVAPFINAGAPVAGEFAAPVAETALKSGQEIVDAVAKAFAEDPVVRAAAARVGDITGLTPQDFANLLNPQLFNTYDYLTQAALKVGQGALDISQIPPEEFAELLNPEALNVYNTLRQAGVSIASITPENLTSILNPEALNAYNAITQAIPEAVGQRVAGIASITPNELAQVVNPEVFNAANAVGQVPGFVGQNIRNLASITPNQLVQILNPEVSNAYTVATQQIPSIVSKAITDIASITPQELAQILNPNVITSYNTLARIPGLVNQGIIDLASISLGNLAQLLNPEIFNAYNIITQQLPGVIGRGITDIAQITASQILSPEAINALNTLSTIPGLISQNIIDIAQITPAELAQIFNPDAIGAYNLIRGGITNLASLTPEDLAQILNPEAVNAYNTLRQGVTDLSQLTAEDLLRGVNPNAIQAYNQYLAPGIEALGNVNFDRSLLYPLASQVGTGAEAAVLNKLLNGGKNELQNVQQAEILGLATGPLLVSGEDILLAVRNAVLYGALPSGVLAALFGERGQQLEDAILAGQSAVALIGAFQDLAGPLVNSITGRAATLIGETASEADLANIAPKNPTAIVNALAGIGGTAPQGAIYGGAATAIQNVLQGQPATQNVASNTALGAGLGGLLGAILPFLPNVNLENVQNPNLQGGEYIKGLSVGNLALVLQRTLPEDIAQTLISGLTRGEITSDDISSILASNQINYLYQLTTKPFLNAPELLAANPSEASTNNIDFATVKTPLQRTLFLDGIQNLAVKLGDTTPEGAQLAELFDQYKTIFQEAPKLNGIFTKLTKESVSTENAERIVNEIKLSNEAYEHASIADKNAAIVGADPTITNGRIWLNALTPEQNIAFNDFITNQYDARYYGTASVRYQLAEKFRLGGDADIFLAKQTDDGGLRLANNLLDLLNKADPSNPLTLEGLNIENSESKGAIDIHPEFSEINPQEAPAMPLGFKPNEPLRAGWLSYSVDPTSNTFLGKLNSVVTLRIADDGSLYLAPAVSQDYPKGEAGFRIKDVPDAAAIAQRLYDQLNDVDQKLNAGTLEELKTTLQNIYDNIKGENDPTWNEAYSKSLNEPITATTIAGTGPIEVNSANLLQGAIVSSASRALSQDQFSEVLNSVNSRLSSLSHSLPVSPSISPSLSPSVSPSVSPSISPSVSPSVSVSPSPSVSPSVSPSTSPSTSPSVSLSPSVSPSTSPSVSPSISPSVSPSPSPSTSPSISPSPSVPPSQEPKKIILPYLGPTGYSPQQLANLREVLKYQNIYTPSLLALLFPERETQYEATYNPLKAISGTRPLVAPLGSAPRTLRPVTEPEVVTETNYAVPGIESPETVQENEREEVMV